MWPRWVKAKDLGFELKLAPDNEDLNFGLSGPLLKTEGISIFIYKVAVL